MTLTDEEKLYITELIHEVAHEIEDDSYNDYYELLKELRKESAGIYDGMKKLNERMDSIEKMIITHSVGVQNVYNEFNKITMNKKLTKLIIKLSQVKDILDSE